MACVKCVLNRIEGTGMNVRVDDGEVRILGCQKHRKILLDRFKMGVKQEEAQQQMILMQEKEDNKENEERNSGIDRPDTADKADFPEDYSGDDNKDIREEGI